MDEYLPESPPSSDPIAIWAHKEFQKLQDVIKELQDKIAELEG